MDVQNLECFVPGTALIGNVSRIFLAVALIDLRLVVMKLNGDVDDK